ncbi:MAG: hypothetical protein AAGH99_01575 [Planctomycetota bacterium]
MTRKLRPEFDQARKNYQSERYAGDLAADLGLGGQTSFGPPVWRRFAMAAAVLLSALTAWWFMPGEPSGPDGSVERVAIESNPEAVEGGLITRSPAQASPTPPAVGVRLTSTPSFSRPDDGPRRTRFDAPQRPRTLSVGLTPRRFPGLRFKQVKSPPLFQRNTRDEKPNEDLS